MILLNILTDETGMDKAAPNCTRADILPRLFNILHAFQVLHNEGPIEGDLTFGGKTERKYKDSRGDLYTLFTSA